ncbi:MAG: hypothetical protein PHC29_06695 [Candidatus Omnitrophica bacterium]|nr:hypothetical protein [Candidatus Omnitrophota bacterium]
MKKQFKSTIICLIVSILIFNYGLSSGENNPKETAKNDPGVTFEQALKNYEVFKQKEQDETAKKINIDLNRVTEEWIAQAKENKAKLLGTRLEQNWEKLALYFPISPSHYEYYLRGYKYSVIKNDVVKSDSITSPFKATLSIKEELYVEKNHSPDISDASPYFYTVTTSYNLNFEYKQNKLELTNTDTKIVNIENAAPDQIKKRTL